MTGSKPSTFVRDSVVVCSNVALTFVRSSATRAHAVHAVKPFLTRSVVAAAARHFIHRYRAVRNHHHADTPANARKHVATLRCLTTVTKTMRLVPNAPFLWRSGACAGRRLSRTSNAGCRTCVAATCVATSCVVALTFVANLATGLESAKTRMAKPASSSVANPRKCVVIQTRTCATLPSPARKRSHARARSSLLATARRRNKR